jgi:SAM-dependent methyltransferase
MGDSEKGQVSVEAAKIYEDGYVPALFQEWCPRIIETAGIEPGHHIVDVACGTGALSIAAYEHVVPDGSIVGVDINEGMLDIARSKSSSIEWLNAPAEALPFKDDIFDRSVCQFGLMYFEDRVGAIREMIRVLKPGGSLVVTVWDKLINNPGLAAEEYLWQKLFGGDIEETPYCLGDKEVLEQLFLSANSSSIQITTHEGTARFDSIESWIHTGAMGWTEEGALNNDQLDLLINTAEKDLTRFCNAGGGVVFPTSAHIVFVSK